MKQHPKNLVLLSFSLILCISFYIYFSEYDVSPYLSIPFFIATFIFSLIFIKNNLQNKKLKLIFSSIILLFTIMLFLWEVLLASLKSANEISQTWNINEFEIQSVTRAYNGPEPSFYTLKEVYCFGLIYKEMGISFPKNMTEIDNKCILEFVDVNLAFDLCNLKQVK
jgi:energy-coupling factor transporter transmembrane protein EcfT